MLALALGLTACASSQLRAQRLIGAGEDASVLRRGDLRWSLGSRWSVWDESLDGNGKRIAINGAFTSADAGVEFFGGLAPTQDGLRTALGDPTARVSLGATRLRSEFHQDVIPLAIEVGVTKRVTVGVSLPLVNSYVSAVFDINRGNPSPANLGLNPGFGSNAIAGQATLVQTQANAAVSALQAAFPACFTAAPGAGCAATVSLAANTASLGSGVAAVFGATGRFAPTSGSALSTALSTRFALLNAQLRTALGIPVGGADPISARPVSAAARMALADFNTVLLTPGYGVRGDTLTSLERSALGDIEVTARWQWFNSVDVATRDSGAGASRGVRFRSVAGLTARLPTAGRRYNGQFLDVGVADGATGIELRTTTDLAVGDHFWASVTGRYTHLLADRLERRIPLGAREALVPAWRQQSVSRQLGDYAELEVTPRWMFNGYFAASADYFLFLRRGSTFSGGPITATDPYTNVPVLLDPSQLNSPHQIAHRFGVGLAYSTVPAHGRGKTRIPLDIRWQRVWTVGGETTAFVMQDRLEFRVITGLFGQGP